MDGLDPTRLQVEDLARHIIALEQFVAEKVRQGAQLEAVVMVLLARVGDTSRVTVKEAAVLEEKLYGKGSVKSVRSKIRADIYTLEKRSGEKEARISIAQIAQHYSDAFLPIGVWRRAHERKRETRRR